MNDRRRETGGGQWAVSSAYDMNTLSIWIEGIESGN